MMIKFLDCNSEFSVGGYYKSENKSNGLLIMKYIAKSRLDGFPIFDILFNTHSNISLDEYNYGFKFSKIEIIRQLEDNIATISNTISDYQKSLENKRNDLHHLMCQSLDISEDCILDENGYKSVIRKLKMDKIFDISKNT